MRKPAWKRVLSLLTGALVGLAIGAKPAAGFLTADYAGFAQVSVRDAEPITITGADAEFLIGVPVDQLFVYVYSGGTWRQIKSQVDEVTLSGMRVANEDGVFDANDEIVFMAKDLGEEPRADKPITAALPIGPVYYQIEVTDPLYMMQTGWASLVQSRVLSPTDGGNYVTFDAGYHRLIATGYALGLGVMHAGADYLTLNDSGTEILDRTKVRLSCHIPLVCPLTEDSLPSVPDDLIKNGPVRVVLRGGQIMAYGAMVQWISAYSIPPSLQGAVRLSTDFNEAASGATYYNAAIPGGVTVDGKPDFVPAAPVSHWWQLSTPVGTLIQVADTASIEGDQSNYYVDNLAWDAADTGDRRHYGDTGIVIENPRSAFTYTVRFYMVPGRQANVGFFYEAGFFRPLSVKTTRQGSPSPSKTYLPILSVSSHESSLLLPGKQREELRSAPWNTHQEVIHEFP